MENKKNAEQLKETIEVGQYIGVTTEEGYFIGVVSKIRNKSFDLHGFLLAGAYDEYTTKDPTIQYSSFYFDEIHRYQEPLYPLHEYLASEFQELRRLEQFENEQRTKGQTEDQIIEILEGAGYRFFDYGDFDKDLFLNIASDLYEYNEEEELWYKRDNLSDASVDFLYLCNACNETYEDELNICESCDGSIRKVHKMDLGI